MEKSSISKLANSTFTSHFFEEEKEENSCIVPIKNNRVDMLHAFITPSLIEGKGQKTKPLILHAAFYSSPASAVYLLRKGTKLNATDADGRTVFHICAYTGHTQVLKAIRNEIKLIRIKKLSEQYIALLSSNNYKRTDVKGGNLKISVSENRKLAFLKMQQAIGDMYQKFVFKMVEDTFNSFITAVKSNGRNCFHLASLNRYQRCLNIMQLMFEELSDFNLHLDHETLDVFRQVNACFSKEDQKIDPRLYQDALQLMEEAIQPQKLQTIKKNINKRVEEEIGIILASKDVNGQTPLYLASKDGCTAIINLIRKWQPSQSKNSQDKNDLIKIACHNLARSHIMDLCEASKESNSTTMNFLLSCGEEINKKKTIFGTFALLEAIKAFEKGKNLDPVRTLIISGADINEQDTNGWTVLHHACERGLKDILDLIFKLWEEGKTKKILINKFTNKNYHILHIAAMNNHPEIIEFLLTSNSAKKLQINTNAIDGDRCTMLHHAARKGAVQALKKILEKSPDLIYEVDIRSNSALHYAAMSDHVACIKYLLYFDSDSDKIQLLQNSRGKLAKDLTVNKKPFQSVFSAAREGDVNQVRKMISENASLRNATTPMKLRTLLILAVMNQHLLVVKYLIEQGADPTHKDKFSKTARDYAEESLKNSKSKHEQVIAKNIASLFS